MCVNGDVSYFWQGQRMTLKVNMMVTVKTYIISDRDGSSFDSNDENKRFIRMVISWTADYKKLQHRLVVTLVTTVLFLLKTMTLIDI